MASLTPPHGAIVPPPPVAVAHEEENPQGWGFADSVFKADEAGVVRLSGRRYELSGRALPDLLPWMSGILGLPLDPKVRKASHYPPQVPAPLPCPGFQAAAAAIVGEAHVRHDDELRLRCGHGHTQDEIYRLRFGSYRRVPDLVVLPGSHDEVVALVQAAERHDVVILPYGGGTNVTDALACREEEHRPIVALAMGRMNRILWVDPANRMACIEAGAPGRVLMRELEQLGWTLGHEPDSVEFSTLGGWVATHASGMKKNRYGNIEDLLLDVTVVGAGGVVARRGLHPRDSIGMDPKRWVLGSEGNLGVITACVVKLFPLPERRAYGSVLFHDLEAGYGFLRELQASGQVPASVRLMDALQFQFGQALKPKPEGLAVHLKKAERFFVLKVKGFDPQRLAVATLVFEGSASEVKAQEALCRRLAKRHQGMWAGAENGRRGYELTYAIAYIRDLVFEHGLVAESFETSVPWGQALELYRRVIRRVEAEHAARGLPGKPFISGRITQLYDTGVAIYFYMAFSAQGVERPNEVYLELEAAARAEILAAGGSLSHHHGVGKLRQGFLPAIMSEGARAWVQQVKQALDPSNRFGAGNAGVLGDSPPPAGVGEVPWALPVPPAPSLVGQGAGHAPQELHP